MQAEEVFTQNMDNSSRSWTINERRDVVTAGFREFGWGGVSCYFYKQESPEYITLLQGKEQLENKTERGQLLDQDARGAGEDCIWRRTSHL